MTEFSPLAQYYHPPDIFNQPDMYVDVQFVPKFIDGIGINRDWVEQVQRFCGKRIIPIELDGFVRMVPAFVARKIEYKDHNEDDHNENDHVNDQKGE